MLCTAPLCCGIYCLSGAVLCTASLWHCFISAPLGLYSSLPILSHALHCSPGALLCTATPVLCPLGTVFSTISLDCVLHCPFWAVFCTTPLCTVLCTAPIFGLYFNCPYRGTMLCALPFWVSVLCSANYALPVWAVLHYPSGNCALYFLTVLLRALCSVHCPSGAFLLCTTLWCPVLCTGSDSGLPFWSSVLCPTHHGHYASVQPFLGHYAL